MKQLFQDVGSGKTSVADIPRPRCKRGHVLIKTTYSLISAGTERMLVDFGRSNFIDKARKQPEKVKMILDKIKTDGLMPTIDAVRDKLDQPMPMGYSNVGVVLEVGSGVTEFKVGDRVLSNGRHAELVCVPKNLCARIPNNVSDADAVFTVVGSIALQGIRLIQPTLGECVVVTGLGLIGLIAVQILKANGCRVLGLDFDQEKLDLAKKYGAEVVNLATGADPIAAAEAFSRGNGVDAVLITASTDSNEPMHQAATMCRQRGRVVLVGVVGLDLQRGDFYEKEISFQVSCSYGPGRYDPFYEDEGNDYPIGFVRWTEKRNFEAILDMFSTNSLSVNDLKSASFPIEQAAEAYNYLLTDKGALGIQLQYPQDAAADERATKKTYVLNTTQKTSSEAKNAVIGAIGAGNYAGRMLLPAFQGVGATLKTIASSQGLSGTHIGKKLNFELNTTDSDTLFEDDEINTIVIATQHNTHARFVIQALNAGKNVFVEKPLALNQKELDDIDAAYKKACEKGIIPKVMVGFNRRFSPLTQKMKSLVAKSQAPISMVYTCNAGDIPADSWVQNPELGGGRIIGEACHFIDMARFIAGSPIQNIQASAMKQPEGMKDCQDTATITLTFENGSMSTIHYFANGHSSFSKERIEVFQGGQIFVLDNFRSLEGYGVAGFKKQKVRRQNKGQSECCKAYVQSIEEGTDAPVSYQELMEVSQACVDVMSILNGA